MAFDNLKARSRYFRVLLYLDNEQHLAAAETIRTQYEHDYLCCKHTGYDGEKDHVHYVLWFDNPRSTETVCRVLGFVDPLGIPDDQFVRAIVKKQENKVDRQLKSACIYLVHANAPEKEQYPVSALEGDKDKIAWTCQQIVKYERNSLDMSDCVLGILDWIARQDDFIRVAYFGRWLCGSPYFKANSNRIVWAAIREHNLRIYQSKQPSEFGGLDTCENFRELTQAEWDSMQLIYGE